VFTVPLLEYRFRNLSRQHSTHEAIVWCSSMPDSVRHNLVPNGKAARGAKDGCLCPTNRCLPVMS